MSRLATVGTLFAPNIGIERPVRVMTDHSLDETGTIVLYGEDVGRKAYVSMDLEQVRALLSMVEPDFFDEADSLIAALQRAQTTLETF